MEGSGGGHQDSKLPLYQCDCWSLRDDCRTKPLFAGIYPLFSYSNKQGVVTYSFTPLLLFGSCFLKRTSLGNFLRRGLRDWPLCMEFCIKSGQKSGSGFACFCLGKFWELRPKPGVLFRGEGNLGHCRLQKGIK